MRDKQKVACSILDIPCADFPWVIRFLITKIMPLNTMEPMCQVLQNLGAEYLLPQISGVSKNALNNFCVLDAAETREMAY